MELEYNKETVNRILNIEFELKTDSGTFRNYNDKLCFVPYPTGIDRTHIISNSGPLIPLYLSCHEQPQGGNWATTFMFVNLRKQKYIAHCFWAHIYSNLQGYGKIESNLASFGYMVFNRPLFYEYLKKCGRVKRLEIKTNNMIVPDGTACLIQPLEE